MGASCKCGEFLGSFGGEMRRSCSGAVKIHKPQDYRSERRVVMRGETDELSTEQLKNSERLGGGVQGCQLGHRPTRQARKRREIAAKRTSTLRPTQPITTHRRPSKNADLPPEECSGSRVDSTAALAQRDIDDDPSSLSGRR
jgi:hypothetical protein